MKPVKSGISSHVGISKKTMSIPGGKVCQMQSVECSTTVRLFGVCCYKMKVLILTLDVVRDRM